jgi:hypothetical protein
MLQHRAHSDKIDILFGKIISPQATNEWLQALSLAGGQNDAATLNCMYWAVHITSPFRFQKISLFLSFKNHACRGDAEREKIYAGNSMKYESCPALNRFLAE